jgi:aminopeptidase-like protein
VLPERDTTCPADIGARMYALARDLYPICRSITGSGVRQTLDILGTLVPLSRYEVPTGTRVFDWTVPPEWNIREAYVTGPDGTRVIDFKASSLHVVSYSQPVRARLTLGELRPHLFTRPDFPDVIPYRTTYYTEGWGFCLPHRQLEQLSEGEYDVVIDATLEPGSLSYGECFVPGTSDDEVVISCHICHPSLANDNLSGMVLVAHLARFLSGRLLRYGYRFLFVPGTIGSITWLARNEDRLARIQHGLVITGIGDAGPFTYKKSRRGNAEIDRAAAHVLTLKGGAASIVNFSPYGYDERQFCSPGLDLPVGCLMRTPHGQYREYHTSADNLTFISPEALEESFRTVLQIVSVLEHNGRYVNQNPKCEPQLGRRGLYRAIGGDLDRAGRELAMLWVLNLSDGTHTLLDIAERAGLRFDLVRTAAMALAEHGLLKATP